MRNRRVGWDGLDGEVFSKIKKLKRTDPTVKIGWLDEVRSAWVGGRSA